MDHVCCCSVGITQQVGCEILCHHELVGWEFMGEATQAFWCNVAEPAPEICLDSCCAAKAWQAQQMCHCGQAQKKSKT